MLDYILAEEAMFNAIYKIISILKKKISLLISKVTKDIKFNEILKNFNSELYIIRLNIYVSQFFLPLW
jgi:hypothetical protein